MPFYLTEFIDDGPYKGGRRSHAVGQEEPGSGIIDLRADGGATVTGGGFNACFLWRPSAFVDARAIPLADGSQENVSAARRAVIETGLGKSNLPSRFDALVAECMLRPPPSRWNAVRPDSLGTRYSVYLGPLEWHQNVIAGGSDGRLIDRYEQYRMAGGGVRRPLARDTFDTPLWRNVICWLRSRHVLTWAMIVAAAALLDVPPVMLLPVLATDNFNRANSTTLGANWTDINIGWGVTTNEADATNAADAQSSGYSAITWPNDQYAQCVLRTMDTTADEGAGPLLRGDATNIYLSQGNTADVRLYKRLSGIFTQLGSTAGAAASGDKLYAEAQGSSLLVQKNGTTVVGPVTDTAIASGRAGLWDFDDVATVDDWEGGDFAAAARQRTLMGVGT